MAILKVARLGHPVLRKSARTLVPQEILSAPIKSLISDMIETMHEYGGVGLAAPQVHASVRIAIIEFSEDNSRYPDQGSQALSVYINPVINVLDETLQENWEGCLSVPGLRGLVERPRKIHVQYLDQSAKPCEIEAEGFLATVFQHEFDHLEGRLYVDRLKDSTQFAFDEEYRRYLHVSKEAP